VTRVSDEYDATIVSLLAEGLTAGEVARRILVGRHWVCLRANVLGLEAIWRANGLAEPKRRRRQRARSRDEIVAAVNEIVGTRSDNSASILARTVRAQAAAGVAYSDNGIACLHDHGLSLDDIESALGVPPSIAARAIRQYSEARP